MSPFKSVICVLGHGLSCRDPAALVAGPLDTSPLSLLWGVHLEFNEVNKKECTGTYMFQAKFRSPNLDGSIISSKSLWGIFKLPLFKRIAIANWSFLFLV